MEFNDYQKKAWGTAIYPKKGDNLFYPALGLGGEIGEVLEKIKKIMRDEDGKVTPERKEGLKKELGDVFWYLAAISTELDLELEEIIRTNLEKQNSRKERNQLHGEGDNR